MAVSDPMTYRERREAKAERLREWAEKREARQSALNEAARADEAATGIPFGQPILVGHHSERRHRNAIERMDRAMGASVENLRKAQEMAARADVIEAQAATAIYSDDPDAIERLTEKIAKLEAQREHVKQANAKFRKEHRTELKAMTAYQRNQAQPFPSYVGENLSGNISRLRKRLAALSVPQEQERPRMLIARYDGVCRKCGADVEKGETIAYYKRSREVECEACHA